MNARTASSSWPELHAFCMEWNAENQLTRVTKNTVEQARFKYDPLGRRVEKVAGGVTTTYVLNSWDILRETLSSGGSYKHIHGTGFDEPLAREDGVGVLSYYQADGLGSIAKTTSPAGAVTTSLSYEAFGQIQQGAPSPYGFAARDWDPETTLSFNRARYYDPKAGRFISEDPIGFLGGIDFYTYVRNNPVRFIDPSGLTVTECHRPMQFGGIQAKGVPHGLLWSSKCQQSYSFGPKVPFFGSPGHITTDDNPFDPTTGKTRPNYTCGVTYEGQCFEDCVCKYIQQHSQNPPWYSTAPQSLGGNSCTDMKSWVVTQCTLECRGKD